MPEKGTLMPRSDKIGNVWEGASPLHGLILGEGVLWWREKPLVCFEWKYCVSLCKLKFMFPCVNVIPIQSSP